MYSKTIFITFTKINYLNKSLKAFRFYIQINRIM